MLMSFPMDCPECDERIRIPAEDEGKQIRCKSCGARFVARPAADDDQPASPGKSSGYRRDEDDDRPRTSATRRRDDEDEPRRRRKTKGKGTEEQGGVPIPVAVLIIGAVTLIGGGTAFYFYFARGDKSAETPVAAAEPTKQPAKVDLGTASTANWVDFAPPDGVFTARFPHQPSVKTQRFQTQGGAVESNVYEAHTGPVMTRLVAGGLPGLRPGDAISNAEIERWLELNCNAIIRGMDGARQVSRKPVDIDGRTGREVEFAADDGSAGVARVLIWKARMTILLVVDKRGKPEPAVLEKFFGGFEPK
jgi:hypothetical protein